jgi:hypothetical protein
MKRYVAYHRSGSNFFHQVISEYCGGIAYDGSVYSPSHDRGVRERTYGCLYVWRNPVDSMFSHFSATYCNEKGVMDLSLMPGWWFEFETYRRKRHFEFYWEHAGLVVRYKDLTGNKAWYDILTFLGLDYNEEKILECSAKITLDTTIKWNPSKWFNDFLATDEYKQGREEFRERYGDIILDECSRYLNKDRNYLTQEDD